MSAALAAAHFSNAINHNTHLTTPPPVSSQPRPQQQSGTQISQATSKATTPRFRALLCHHPIHPFFTTTIQLNHFSTPPPHCPLCTARAHTSLLRALAESWTSYGGPWTSESQNVSRTRYIQHRFAYRAVKMRMCGYRNKYERMAEAEDQWEEAEGVVVRDGVKRWGVGEAWRVLREWEGWEGAWVQGRVEEWEEENGEDEDEVPDTDVEDFGEGEEWEMSSESEEEEGDQDEATGIKNGKNEGYTAAMPSPSPSPTHTPTPTPSPSSSPASSPSLSDDDDKDEYKLSQETPWRTG